MKNLVSLYSTYCINFRGSFFTIHDRCENHCHRLNNTTLQNSFPSCIKASFIEQFVYTKNNSPARWGQLANKFVYIFHFTTCPYLLVGPKEYIYIYIYIIILLWGYIIHPCCRVGRPSSAYLCTYWAGGSIQEHWVFWGQGNTIRGVRVNEWKGEVRSRESKRVIWGGMLPRLSKAEVRRYGLPSRVMFQTTPLIRISIRKEQDKGRL